MKGDIGYLANDLCKSGNIIPNKSNEILEVIHVPNRGRKTSFTMKIEENDIKNKKIKNNEIINISKDNLSTYIGNIFKRILIERFGDSIEANPEYVYVVKSNLVLKGHISSKEYFLDFSNKGILSDLFKDCENKLTEKIEEIGINNDFEEGFDIHDWKLDFYAFDIKDQKEGMIDQETPTQFLTDSNIINNGEIMF